MTPLTPSLSYGVWSVPAFQTETIARLKKYNEIKCLGKFDLTMKNVCALKYDHQQLDYRTVTVVFKLFT